MVELHRHRPTTELAPKIQLFHILPRLSAKSVGRCTCVSKQWHSFLKTPAFTKIHFHHVTEDDHQNHHKLLVLSTKTLTEFHTIDCEAPEDGVIVGRPLPFETIHRDVRILTSFHGLVCVGLLENRRYDIRYTGLILWNPLTGEHKTLSKANSCKLECCDYMEIGRRAFTMYYNSSEDDYKLLSLSTKYVDAHIYSLKSDSWRPVESTEDFKRIPYLGEHWGSGVLLNEKLYFLIYKVCTSWSMFTTSFDIKTRKLKVIPTPSTPSFGNTGFSGLTVVRGQIYLYMFHHNKERFPSTCYRMIELWRMDGDGDGDWTNVVCYRPTPSFCFVKEPLHLMKNGNLLMPCRSRGYLSKVDPVKHVEDSFLCGYADDDISPNEKYIETLVSPNQHIQ